MNVAIIEDEAPAAEKLERYLKRYDESILVITNQHSVQGAVEWFQQNHDKVDLVFMDIQLSDGLSFSIFEEVEITKPIIFTTAYDEYALKAFDVNSIAYLLKPITLPDITSAMEKLKLLQKETIESPMNGFKEMLLAINNQKNFKSRFMIKIGGHIRSITTHQIMFFYAEGRNAYIINEEGRRLIIDYKLEELENLLDPEKFFRVNRTFILNIDSIKEVLVYSNSRLKVVTKVEAEKEIIVSREKVNAFKQWFDGE